MAANPDLYGLQPISDIVQSWTLGSNSGSSPQQSPFKNAAGSGGEDGSKSAIGSANLPPLYPSGVPSSNMSTVQHVDPSQLQTGEAPHPGLYAPPQQQVPVLSSDPGINQTAQQLYALRGQIANYQPMALRHPVLSGLFNMPVSPQDLAMTNQMQAKQQMLQDLMGAQQAYANNQTNAGFAAPLAKDAGLGAIQPGTQVSPDMIKMLYEIAQGHGQGAAAQSLNTYNQNLANYQTQIQNLQNDYNMRKIHGQLTPEEIKAGGPALPAQPTMDMSGIGNYTDLSKLSGITGSSGEARKTGEEAGAAAGTLGVTQQENEAKIKQAQAEMGQQKLEADEKLNETSRHNKEMERLGNQKETNLTGYRDEKEKRLRELQDTKGVYQKAKVANATASQLNMKMVGFMDDMVKKGISYEKYSKTPGFIKLSGDILAANKEANRLNALAEQAGGSDLGIPPSMNPAAGQVNQPPAGHTAATQAAPTQTAAPKARNFNVGSAGTQAKIRAYLNSVSKGVKK